MSRRSGFEPGSVWFPAFEYHKDKAKPGRYVCLLEFFVDYHDSHSDGVEDDGLWLFAGCDVVAGDVQCCMITTGEQRVKSGDGPLVIFLTQGAMLQR